MKKLTVKKWNEIFERYRNGERADMLAKEYGVGMSTIHRKHAELYGKQKTYNSRENGYEKKYKDLYRQHEKLKSMYMDLVLEKEILKQEKMLKEL